MWFLGVFIHTLVLSAHAGDEEIDSLFTPVTSMYSAPDDAAVGVRSVLAVSRRLLLTLPL